MRRWIVGWAVALVVVAAAATGAHAQDRYFASSFRTAPDGAVYELDFAAGTRTLIVDGYDLPEDIVAKASTGEIFVCESIGNRVWGYDLGAVMSFFVTGAIDGPEGPSISPAGDLYINTRGDPTVPTGVWSIAGADPANAPVNVIPAFGTFGEGSAFGRAGSSDGGLLAVDRARGLPGQGKVVLSNPPGDPAIVLISGLEEPFGIDADSSGNIYVAERELGQITKFDADGLLIGPFITGIRPSFLEVDSDDHVIVSEGDRRVLRIDPSGAIVGDVPVPNAIGIAVLRQPVGECPHSQGFWKTHPRSWPVDEITMGGETYTKDEARALLKTPVRGDASLILAKQLIAAKVNVENGSDDGPISAEIQDADDLLATYSGRLPLGVRPGSTDGKQMTDLAHELDRYNNQQLTPNCRSSSPLRRGEEGGGGCGALPAGGMIGPADILGSFLPWLAVLLGLGALRLQGRRRLAPAASRA